MTSDVGSVCVSAPINGLANIKEFHFLLRVLSGKDQDWKAIDVQRRNQNQSYQNLIHSTEPARPARTPEKETWRNLKNQNMIIGTTRRARLQHDAGLFS